MLWLKGSACSDSGKPPAAASRRLETRARTRGARLSLRRVNYFCTVTRRTRLDSFCLPLHQRSKAAHRRLRQGGFRARSHNNLQYAGQRNIRIQETSVCRASQFTAIIVVALATNAAGEKTLGPLCTRCKRCGGVRRMRASCWRWNVDGR